MMNHILRTIRLRTVTFLMLLGFVVACTAAYGEDWPTYRHDNARSGVTSEKIELPLSECWVFKPRHAPEPAWGEPKSEPVEGILELPRVRFDDAFHVVVADNALYFGSSADNKIYSLDALTGKVRWTTFTGGPVRLAPTVWKDRVFVGSDDGFAYCLGASDGRIIWKFHAAPNDQKLLGHGKMISLWPLRTGVLVDDGIAYFGAGIFPAEGVYFYAVRANNAKLVWRNDTCGEATRSGISPQGYLLASSSMLYAPMGRVSPAALDRKSGRFMNSAYFGKRVGGTYALLADDYLFTGTEEMIAYQQKTRAKFAWFPGRKLIVTHKFSYMLTDRDMSALDRTIYPKASMKKQSALQKKQSLQPNMDRLKRQWRSLSARVKDTQKNLKTVDGKLEALTKGGKDSAGLKKQHDDLSKNLKIATDELDRVNKELAKLQDQLKKADDELRDANAAIASSIKWRLPCQCSDSLILAGGVLFAGGQDRVIAVDAATGEKLWTSKVDGRARGLAVAAGRLFVSTDKGAIYCFGSNMSPQLGTITQAVIPSPYPHDKLTPLFKSAADAIIRATNIKRGYCLVIGAGTGRLAFELAKRTELKIYGVEQDKEKVEAARKALDSAGMYGSRVCIEQLPPDHIPYSDYFANLIISETALVSGKFPGDVKEMYRMLRPGGGVAYIGQPAKAVGLVNPIRPDLLKRLKAELRTSSSNETEEAQVINRDGLWLKITRAPLKGTANWTHEYANPGNTASSGDKVVKCPIGVLWFGRPGPGKMVNRHASAAGPLCVNGILFIQGENVVMAYDAYNGLKLWERPIKGDRRTGLKSDCSNIAANDGSFFVAVGNKCLRLDAATGETKKTYNLPTSPDGKPRRWGYIAVVGNLLFGSTTRGRVVSDSLFAIDIRTGKQVWVHRGKNIMHITIAIGDGKVFFADKTATVEQRQEALKERIEKLKGLKGSERQKEQQAIKNADVRLVSALDADTGKILWQEPIDVSNCVRISSGGGDLTAIYSKGVLLLCGQPWNGHFWKEFFAGEFSRRSVIALSAADGKLMWSGKLGYRSRPLVVGDTLIAEPWAYDLQTGKPKERINPFTGMPERWQMARPGHHCGPISASAFMLFFRSWSIAYYDLIGDYGTLHFGAQRLGCHINAIAADGLFLAPEGSSGCMCAFPNMCTVVFKPRKENKAWGLFSSPSQMTPVKHLAINLGAPGDRKDDTGTLWLGYPHPGGALVFQFKIGTQIVHGGYFKHNPTVLKIKGTHKPWVFTSGCTGIMRCSVPLIGKGQMPGIYRVRLAFAELDNDRAGQRVFDVKLQDKLVLNDFDIFKEAGGRNIAIVKEFKGIEVDRDLVIEFIPKIANLTRERAPLINGIEVVRTQTLRLGVVPPPFLMSDVESVQVQNAKIINFSDKKFDGTLTITSPKGIRVEPNQTEIHIVPNGEKAVKLKAIVAKGVNAGDYEIGFKLTRRNGTVELEKSGRINYLGDKREVVLKAIEDAYVSKRFLKTNRGGSVSLAVDGGNKEMGDEGYAIAYFKFRLEIPGRPISARLRLHGRPEAGSESGNAGKVFLVEQSWNEKTITYENQPKHGAEVGRIGRVKRDELIERELNLPLEGKKEVSLAIVPTTCDGAGFYSREGGYPAELVVKFGAKRH